VAVTGGLVARLALATYLLAAAAGLVLVARLMRGGVHLPGARGRLSPVLVFGHFTLAAIGLLMWLAYLSSAVPMLAWMVVLTLVPVVAVGVVMLARWLRVRRRGIGVEARLPLAVVVGHGLLGTLTVVLVLVTAVRGAGR
jgi:hypothetical protein